MADYDISLSQKSETQEILRIVEEVAHDCQPPKLRLVARKRTLKRINEQIAAITATKPGSEVRAFFNATARLARVATEVSGKLDRFPGLNLDEFREALDLWYRLSDYADTVAWCCRGGSQTIAEALITLRFLESLVPNGKR
jgi:hypothetical protein